jgi:two-component system, sensor histidine kinase
MSAEAAIKPARRASDAFSADAFSAEADHADQVRMLFAHTPTSLTANAVGAAVLVGLYSHAAHPLPLWAWGAAMLALCIVRAVLARQFARAQPQNRADFDRWRSRWNTGTLAAAALWGLASIVFYASGDTLQQVALVMIVNSLCVGVVQLLATQPRVLLGYIALSFVPLIIRVAGQGGEHGLQLALVMLLIFAIAALLARNYRTAFERVVELKTKAQHLTEQLAREKAAAEAARGEAEVANRAKTQFFAAASHDLRQPLHALGLFAEALRSRTQHDEPVAHLVNSINASVDALEGLFSELLDITKIDSGGVEPRPEHVAIETIFRRLRLHFEPIAFEKGLQLTLRGGRYAVYADPILVERVLRNLVSNAIRYTDEGGVLVAARRRPGRVLLQVWDTGLGIREPDQERIFEEFYQITTDAQSLPAHQRKGLGLGLAIVKRLCGLMNAPITLRSRPGHGTVFSLALPLGRVPERAAALGLTLDRKRIVIVEDDPAVNSGLQVLLKSWGADVVAFETFEGCRRWAAQLAPDAPVPDLAIVDFRLETGHNGLEVIDTLRQRFGRALPAIMVTGSVMSHHEEQAQAYGFHLLTKPVVPHKLRAMIAFKLAA